MENRWKASVLVVAAMMAATLSKASDAKDPLRFELRAEHFVVVRGSIGALQKLDFVLDTGYTHTTIDRRVARKLGLPEIGSTAAVSLNTTVSASRVLVPELALGNVRAGSVEALAGDLSFLAPAGSIAAVVGMDLLGRLGLTLDYRARTVTFGTPAAGDWNLPLEADFPVPVIRVRIGGEAVRLMVDSGGRDLVLFENRLARRIRSRLRSIGEAALAHGGGQSDARAARIEELELRPDRLETRTAYLVRMAADSYPGLDGVIGATSLGGRRLQFDFARNTLGVAP